MAMSLTNYYTGQLVEDFPARPETRTTGQEDAQHTITNY